MAVEVEIDPELLKSEIKKTYASVSRWRHASGLRNRLSPWRRRFGFACFAALTNA
jgi:hypothetical protein